MRFRSTAVFTALLWLIPPATAEQYLVLISGKRYLGRTSSADKTKFIFCDAKIGAIPDESRLEDTLEKCGGLPVMALPLDTIKLRLLTLSEGAARQDPALAKDAMNAVIELQNMKKPTEEQAKEKAEKVEAKAGSHLRQYMDTGHASLGSKKAVRP